MHRQGQHTQPAGLIEVNIQNVQNDRMFLSFLLLGQLIISVVSLTLSNGWLAFLFTQELQSALE